jgi:ferredoxin
MRGKACPTCSTELVEEEKAKEEEGSEWRRRAQTDSYARMM